MGTCTLLYSNLSVMGGSYEGEAQSVKVIQESWLTNCWGPTVKFSSFCARFGKSEMPKIEGSMSHEKAIVLQVCLQCNG